MFPGNILDLDSGCKTMINGFSKFPAIAGLCLCFSILTMGAALAEDAQVSVRYDVEVKGVTIMKLRFTTQIRGNAYATEITAKTTGMANWFSDYKVEMGTQGTHNSGEFTPASFNRERKKNGKKKEATTNWSGGAPLITQENGDDDFAAMAQVVNGSTVDPLSLLLGVTFGSIDSPCKGGRRVFDGRDVYDVTLSHEEKEDEGRVSCRITLNYVAGKEVANAKPDAAKPDSYGVVLKPVKAAALGRIIWVPEKISGKASGQNFLAKSKELEIQ
jgi:hypothetical protein